MTRRACLIAPVLPRGLAGIIRAGGGETRPAVKQTKLRYSVLSKLGQHHLSLHARGAGEEERSCSWLTIRDISRISKLSCKVYAADRKDWLTFFDGAVQLAQGSSATEFPVSHGTCKSTIVTCVITPHHEAPGRTHCSVSRTPPRLLKSHAETPVRDTASGSSSPFPLPMSRL